MPINNMGITEMTTSMEDALNMSEDELRARSEAAAMGQLQMLRAAVEALIAVSPHPDYIQFRMAQEFAAIANREPQNEILAWVPAAMAAGAKPVLKQFDDASNRNFIPPRE